MDRLLILAKDGQSALEAATKVGLNSNQFYPVTTLDQLKELTLDEGIYAFAENAPLEGLEMKYELQLLPFFQVPTVGYPLIDYIKTLINEINVILNSYTYTYIDDSIRKSIRNKIINMLNSCKITKDNGFTYELNIIDRCNLRIEPTSDKMKVIKDLINAVSLIRY